MRSLLLPGGTRLSWEVEQYPDGWHAVRRGGLVDGVAGPELAPRRLGVYATQAEAWVACGRDAVDVLDEWMGPASPDGGGAYYHETPSGYAPGGKGG